MHRTGDTVTWEIVIECPGCRFDIISGTAAIFPKDPGVCLNADGFEEHLEVCEDFQAKYRELMGW